jgi:hypothetical protein
MAPSGWLIAPIVVKVTSKVNGGVNKKTRLIAALFGCANRRCNIGV